MIKAVIFDFIGTLARVRKYSLEASKLKQYEAIVKAGFNVSVEKFTDAYVRAHQKYRVIRYEELVEVTNAIWISDALNCLGFKTDAEDPRVKVAVNVFFEDYLNSLELNPCAEDMLREVSKSCKLGLISNFTYAPVIHAGLRKLGIGRFFNAILVSADVCWRKPNRKIFQEALKRLGVTACETVYVGDCPQEDIEGAADAGMRTVFVPSQFYSLENLVESKQKPSLIVKDICELRKRIPRFMKNTSRRFQC
jgi:putative hydrolase of the HAD superfamily